VQYELKGTDKPVKAQSWSVLIIGSMSGDRETWRSCCYCSPGDSDHAEERVCLYSFRWTLDTLEIIEIEAGEKKILSKAIKVAEFFLNAGGTAFEPALSQALELISKQSFKKTDVVFITDGNVPIVQSSFLVSLTQRRAKSSRSLVF
jgi:uncharacterized protein with von Willebrand factor type A (vWA) domain